MQTEINNLKSLYGSAPHSADCCMTCGELIGSARQISSPGTSLCERCANVDKHEEER